MTKFSDLPVDVLRSMLETAVAVQAPHRPSQMTVNALGDLYLSYAAHRYIGRHAASEIKSITQSLAAFRLLYGEMDPDALKPLHVLSVRELWIRSNLARSTIQARMQRLRQCWRWGRRRELITSNLPEIDPLEFGHARDKAPIRPVDLELVERTHATVGIKSTRGKGGLSRTASAMLRVMQYTGMRPGEVCDLHLDQIDMTRLVWVFAPALHKTKHKGGTREIFIGERGQAILEPFVAAARERGQGWLFLTRTGARWTPDLLCSAVRNVCDNHGIDNWHPNQLRHTVATQLRESMGLDAAQAVLGHAKISTTQVYAEKQSRLATEAAQRFG